MIMIISGKPIFKDKIFFYIVWFIFYIIYGYTDREGILSEFFVSVGHKEVYTPIKFKNGKVIRPKNCYFS